MEIYKRSEKANPRFDELHLLIALKIVSDNTIVGRKRLMKELELGEGSTKTLLSKLKKEELITSSPNGHEITAKGKKFLLKNLPRGEEIRATELTLSDKNFAFLINEVNANIRGGVEQRDEAIKAGADCAVTLVFDGEKLRFPKEFELKVKNKDVFDEIKSKLHPQKGDFVVIGGGSTKIRALKGALVASKALKKDR